MTPVTASVLVKKALATRPLEEHSMFLRELIAQVGAHLIFLEGVPEAAEAMYRMGDAIATRKQKAE